MSHPTTDTGELTDANAYLDALKKSYSATWHGTERTLHFLMQVIHRQTQQVQNLEGNSNLLDKQIQEKSYMINTLETRLAELENHVNAKDRELWEVKQENDKLKTVISHALSRCREYQDKMLEAEANHQNASAEAASLRVKLVEAEGKAAGGTATAERKEGNSMSSGLSEEQLKKMEAALKKELETRNDVVRKAAREAIGPLRDAYVASLARVKELEEQLQKHQSSESVTTHASGVSSGVNDEGLSSSAPSHIVSGKYRPKPALTPLGQNSNAPPGSHPVSVATPPPLSHPTEINPFSSSTIPTQEVIDLTDDAPYVTESEHPIIEGVTQRLKRKRADSDSASLPPSETSIIQSKAHEPMQGGTDGSQPRDVSR